VAGHLVCLTFDFDATPEPLCVVAAKLAERALMVRRRGIEEAR
jgi:hypothetical protein